MGYSRVFNGYGKANIYQLLRKNASHNPVSVSANAHKIDVLTSWFDELNLDFCRSSNGQHSVISIYLANGHRTT
ncbi:MAG: hypothetical protein CMH52_06970 [Myxococcales bacterium]|nr:hypothetical protein [Myxococcales bacterium]